MASRAIQTFSYPAGGSITIPGNVKRVRVICDQRLTPVAQSVSASGFIAGDGLLYLWGNNVNGQLGDGTVTAHSAPVAVLGSSQIFRFFTTAYGATISNSCFAINNMGNVYAWGVNGSGQLGTGDVVPRSSPVLVSSGIGAGFNALKVVVGANGGINATFLVGSGQLYSVGDNTSGQLGVGDTTARSSPTLVLGGLTFSDVVSGNISNIAAITTAGALYLWGDNLKGQIGDNSTTTRNSPVQVSGAGTWSKVYINSPASTLTTTYGIRTDGTLYAWGSNANGQCGVNDVVARSSPTLVLGGLTVSKLAYGSLTSGQSFAMILTTAGALYGVGFNGNGELGVNDVTPRSSPVAVVGGLTFADVAVFGNTVYAMTAAGVLYSWGLNANGQIGDGTVTPRSSPVAVLGGITWQQGFIFPIGNASVMGLNNQGVPYSWGANVAGQTGIGDNTPRSSPVLVATARRILFALPTVSTDIDVTPGTSYTVTLTNFFATFGSTIVGQNPTQVQVEFLQ